MTAALTGQAPPSPAPTPPPASGPHRAAASHPWRPLLVRMHFYAGVLIGPFVLVLCLSGVAYAFTPQLDRLLYAQELSADPAGRAPLPLATQVEAAVKARPDLRMTGLRAVHGPDETTRVDFAEPGLPAMSSRSVYVDPYTAQVRGELVTRHGGTPLSAWLGALHGDLHLGEPGRIYAELATIWLVIVLVGGLALWWERSRRHRRPGPTGTREAWRRLLVVDRRHPGLHTTMSWHSVVGLWAAGLALVIALTGLMVSGSAGARWTSLLASLNASNPRLSTQLAPAAGAAAAAVPTDGGHSGHSMPAPPASAGTPARPGTVTGAGLAPAGLPVDAILAAAQSGGVTEAVNLTAPKAPGQAWLASEADLTWPVNLDQAAIDPHTGQVVRTLSWSEWPVLAQANRLLLFFHFGRTFGLLNQLALIVISLALTASVLWGYQMWWQRRPHHGPARWGRAPRRGAWRSAPRGRLLLGIAVVGAIGVVLPVFGVSLLVFLAVDAVWGRRRRPAPAETAG
ncbi:MAG: PepSY domain-containing protein [Austwickia sp.]|nr:PepSY domain-containing protein [Austwickia sp.]MBK8437740.1 PepSY domain-containing protein [Austwickia sp.]